MKINKLEIKNFRTIKNALLDFNKKIIIISGDNGQGKTSILLAISLLLFNYTKCNLQDYINWDSNFFELNIEFEYNNKIFKEKIYYDNKKKSERELYIDNNFYKNSDAIDKLNELFDFKLCLASILVEEGTVDLVTINPSERREYLKKIYNLNFDNGIKNIDLEIKELEDTKFKNIENKILLLNNKNYDYKIIIQNEDIKFYNSNLKQLSNYQKEFHILENNINNINKIYDEINLNNLKLTNLEKDKDKYRLKIIDLQKELDTQKELLNLDFNLKINNLEKDKNDYIIKTNNVVENLQSQINNIEIIRLKVFDNNIYEQKKKEKYQIENDIKIINKKLNDCKNGICPTCSKKFDNSDIEKYNNELDDNNKKLIVINLEIKILEIEKNEYELKKIEQDNKKHQLEILQQNLLNEKNNYENKINQFDNFIINEKSNIELKIKNIKDKINSLNLNINEYNDLLQEKSNEYSQIEIIICNLQIELDKLPKINEEYKLQLLNNINELEQKIKKYEEIENINKQNIIHNNNLIKQKEIDSSEIIKLNNQKNSILLQIDDLKKSKIILQKEFPNFILKELTLQLEEDINEFLGLTYNNRYKIKIVEKKDSIYLVYGKNDSDIKNASGFEKQIISLAQKYALSKMQDLNILILDEIDSQGSNENSEILYETINNMCDFTDQIFIISHKIEVKNYLQNNFNCQFFECENGITNEN